MTSLLPGAAIAAALTIAAPVWAQVPITAEDLTARSWASLQRRKRPRRSRTRRNPICSRPSTTATRIRTPTMLTRTRITATPIQVMVMPIRTFHPAGLGMGMGRWLEPRLGWGLAPWLG
jgi:hypothetical protein